MRLIAAELRVLQPLVCRLLGLVQSACLVGLATLCLLCVPLTSIAAAECQDAAAVRVSTDTTSTSAEVASAALGGLVNVQFELNQPQADALAGTTLSLEQLLVGVETVTQAGTPDAALQSQVALSDLISLLADVATESGQAEAALALSTLATQVDPNATLTLADFISTELPASELAEVDVSILQVLSAALSVQSAQSAEQAAWISVDPQLLGLGGEFDAIDIQVVATSGPEWIVAEQGSTFSSGSYRIRVRADIPDVMQSLSLAGLPLLGSADLTTTQVEFVVDSDASQAQLLSVDAMGEVASVELSPGGGELYVGAVGDTEYADRETQLQLSDFVPVITSQLSLSGLLGGVAGADVSLSSEASLSNQATSTLDAQGPTPASAELQLAGRTQTLVDDAVAAGDVALSPLVGDLQLSQSALDLVTSLVQQALLGPDGTLTDALEQLTLQVALPGLASLEAGLDSVSVELEELIESNDGDSCSQGATPGTCRAGACCTGCWDGATCRSGQSIADCGAGGEDCATCNDGLSCTQDMCNMGACGSQVVMGCSIDGMCVDAGTSKPGAACLLCSPTESRVDWTVDSVCDSDGDSVLDEHENPDGSEPDTDMDGVPDYQDPDDDGDGIPTAEENPDPNADGDPSDAQDSDDDGTPDYLDDTDDREMDAGTPGPGVDSGAGGSDADAGTNEGHRDGGVPAADAGTEGRDDAGSGDDPTLVDPDPMDPTDDDPSAPGADAGAGDPGDDAQPDDDDDDAEPDDDDDDPQRPDNDTDDDDVDAGPRSDDALRWRVSGGALCSVHDVQRANTGWQVWCLSLLLSLIWLRRRRFGRRARAAAVICLTLVGLCAAPPASAEGITLNRYRAAPLNADGFGHSSASALPHLVLGANAHLDYANDPLVLEILSDGDEREAGAVVAHQLTLQANAAVGLWDRGVAFVRVPVVLLMQGDDNATNTLGSAPEDAGLGDLAVGGRVIVVGTPDDFMRLGLQATFTLPTAELASGAQSLAGEDTVSALPEVLLELQPGKVRVGVNLGTLIRGGSGFANTELDSELVYGLGAMVPTPAKGLNAHAELSGSTAFNAFAGREESSLEALVGGKYHTSSGWTTGLAGGPGLLKGIGSPDLRLVAMVGYTGKPEEQPPPQISDPCAPDETGQVRTKGCPDADDDGDGIKNASDQCPQQPEDLDGFEDTDGCPDTDNDKDGLLDPDDKCPNDAEDVDQFEDDDGCPDLDNDADGVPDVDDQCPLEPEDVDKFEDADGCPDPDNDADGIPDVNDQCPIDPETKNGVQDEDGCPDTVRVDRESQQILLLEPVYFATGSAKILARSHGMLTEMAGLIQGDTHLGNILVEGHTDSRGSDAYNLRLSEDRARSVREFLVVAGVDPKRLSSKGLGETRPIASNDTKDGRAKNRRVEFHLSGIQ